MDSQSLRCAGGVSHCESQRGKNPAVVDFTRPGPWSLSERPGLVAKRAGHTPSPIIPLAGVDVLPLSADADGGVYLTLTVLA